MKEWSLLIWIPQFGISIVFPLIAFIMLAVWLRDHWGWGDWVIAAGIFAVLSPPPSAFGIRPEPCWRPRATKKNARTTVSALTVMIKERRSGT